MSISRVLRALPLAVALSVAGSAASALTLVLDFGPGLDHDGAAMSAYDDAAFGFSGLDLAGSQAAVLAAVQDHYLGYPTAAADPFSPIPTGYELALDFVIGSAGIAPSNGDLDWYVFSIGEGEAGQSFLGEAFIQSVRGPDFAPAPTGWIVGAVYTDQIATLAGLAGSDAQLINLLAGTVSHEIGHTLGLLHPSGAQANPGESAWSVMATGASPSNMPNAQRVLEREFSYAEAAILADNVGLRPVPLPAPALLLGAAVGVLVLRRPRACAACPPRACAA